MKEKYEEALGWLEVGVTEEEMMEAAERAWELELPLTTGYECERLSELIGQLQAAQTEEGWEALEDWAQNDMMCGAGTGAPSGDDWDSLAEYAARFR